MNIEVQIQFRLESRFTYFAPYVVYIGISKITYIYEQTVYKTWDAANLDGKQQHRPIQPHVSTWKANVNYNRVNIHKKIETAIGIEIQLLIATGLIAS